MDNIPGLDDTLFNQDPSGLECLDSFDRFWQEDEQVESARPSSAERHCDGEQQQQAVEEVDNQLQPVESQQLHDYSSDAEPPPERIQYAIEWKALLKTKRIGMDTEQDVSLAPGAFWDATLRKKLEDLLDRKFFPQDRPEPDDTVVVVSVSKRAERDLIKEFVGFDIGWPVIEERLELWGCHFHAGKRLTVKITFRFRLRNTASRIQADARGRPSATRRMRHEQASQRDAEENKFESHNDVPDTVRQELYAEAGQRTERHRNTRRSLSSTPHTQALLSTPAPTPGDMQCSPGQTPLSAVAVIPSTLERLDIPGCYEDAISDYVKWQQAQAKTEEWIAQFAKASNILLTRGYQLGLFYERQLIALLTTEGVLEGIALSIHSDIKDWLPEYRRKYEENEVSNRETPGGFD
ncbi:hypothetical protein LTR74_018056 [Friedmanniomyces endolithicus]|nr:hypothetical protein LTR74_018056 [Friedmanniomyces endolithicus]